MTKVVRAGRIIKPTKNRVVSLLESLFLLEPMYITRIVTNEYSVVLEKT